MGGTIVKSFFSTGPDKSLATIDPYSADGLSSPPPTAKGAKVPASIAPDTPRVRSKTELEELMSGAGGASGVAPTSQEVGSSGGRSVGSVSVSPYVSPEEKIKALVEMDPEIASAISDMDDKQLERVKAAMDEQEKQRNQRDRFNTILNVLKERRLVIAPELEFHVGPKMFPEIFAGLNALNNMLDLPFLCSQFPDLKKFELAIMALFSLTFEIDTFPCIKNVINLIRSPQARKAFVDNLVAAFTSMGNVSVSLQLLPEINGENILQKYPDIVKKLTSLYKKSEGSQKTRKQEREELLKLLDAINPNWNKKKHGNGWKWDLTAYGFLSPRAKDLLSDIDLHKGFISMAETMGYQFHRRSFLRSAYRRVII